MRVHHHAYRLPGAVFSTVTCPDRLRTNYYAEIINEAPDGSCYVTFIGNETYDRDFIIKQTK